MSNIVNRIVNKMNPVFYNAKQIFLNRLIKYGKEKPCSYDAYLVWFVTLKCNMRCLYCGFKEPLADGFKKEASRTIVETLNKTNKVFKICITGGEPFLMPNLVDIIEELTKRHVVSINTNLTSDNIKVFAERITPSKVTGILASLHIKQLESCGLLNKYADNFLLLKEAGFSVSAWEVAYPSLAPEVNKYKEFFKKMGIPMGFFPYCGWYNDKIYPRSYTAEERELFGLCPDEMGVRYRKDKICNAGYNFAFCWENGDITPCHYQDMQKIGNINHKIEFKNKLMICPYGFCPCPVCVLEPRLFKKALGEAAIPLKPFQYWPFNRCKR